MGNGDFYNLPRKFKVCITGCHVWCAYPEINDVGLTAIRRDGGDSEVGFSLRVGGGLSTDPHLAVRLNAFVHRHQVIPVLKGVAEIFRESEKLRENRERARLKFLFLKHGWTAESFQEELERRIGFQLDPAVEEKPPERYLSRSRWHPSPETGGIFLRWSGGAAGTDFRPADARRGGRRRPVCGRRTAHHQHAEPADRERAQSKRGGPGERVRRRRLAGGRLAVLARRGGLQRFGVLQNRDYRNQEFFPLAGGRT